MKSVFSSYNVTLNRPTGQGAFHVNYAGDIPTYTIVQDNTLEVLTLGTKIHVNL
jgi:hypothetical protein